MFSKPKPAAPAAPRAVLIDREKNVQPPPPAEIIALAVEGAAIKKDMEQMDERLKEINAQIGAAIGAGYTLLLDDIASLPISQSEKVAIADLTALQQVLGERSASLIDSTYSIPDRHVGLVRRKLGKEFDLLTDANHKPTAKLIGMAVDADHPERDALRACLSFTPGPLVVKYLAPKKLPKAA